MMHPGDLVPSGRIDRPLGPVGVLEMPIYCRRDDYAFLPPNALGGLPCVEVPREGRIDRDFIATHTIGWEELEPLLRDCIPAWG